MQGRTQDLAGGRPISFSFIFGNLHVAKRSHALPCAFLGGSSGHWRIEGGGVKGALAHPPKIG